MSRPTAIAAPTEKRSAVQTGQSDLMRDYQIDRREFQHGARDAPKQIFTDPAMPVPAKDHVRGTAIHRRSDQRFANEAGLDSVNLEVGVNVVPRQIFEQPRRGETLVRLLGGFVETENLDTGGQFQKRKGRTHCIGGFITVIPGDDSLTRRIELRTIAGYQDRNARLHDDIAQLSQAHPGARMDDVDLDALARQLGDEAAVARCSAAPGIANGTPEARMLCFARLMRWAIVAADRASGRIEASATTPWFGFTDDVVVRIAPAPGGSRIDVRSVSRVGKSDLGVNARRIRDFLGRMTR